jgi:hypothetical protein
VQPTHISPTSSYRAAGKPERLAAAISQVNAGQEVIVSCMVDGNKEDLHNRTAKIQRMKASLKLMSKPSAFPSPPSKTFRINRKSLN